jgi:simple sugar transport system permease protein
VQQHWVYLETIFSSGGGDLAAHMPREAAAFRATDREFAVWMARLQEAGIAVALLGRNSPIGIVIAALLFGFLDSTAAALQLEEVPNSIVKVMQAIIVLTVVIVNEATTRRMNRRTVNRTAKQLEGTASVGPETVAA